MGQAIAGLQARMRGGVREDAEPGRNQDAGDCCRWGQPKRYRAAAMLLICLGLWPEEEDQAVK